MAYRDVAVAAAYLREADRVGSRSESTQLNLGAYSEERGDYAGALSHYLRAVRLDPTFVPPRKALPRVYRKLGREADARRAELELSELYPSGEDLTRR